MRLSRRFVQSVSVCASRSEIFCGFEVWVRAFFAGAGEARWVAPDSRLDRVSGSLIELAKCPFVFICQGAP
ncbi:MAG: hypothetical protein M2R45_03592 [Verrucomicrobia subdivision 3 bacterium]|nr:hypothetical protein [Limisphaerales bacterium]